MPARLTTSRASYSKNLIASCGFVAVSGRRNPTGTAAGVCPWRPPRARGLPLHDLDRLVHVHLAARGDDRAVADEARRRVEAVGGDDGVAGQAGPRRTVV